MLVYLELPGEIDLDKSVYSSTRNYPSLQFPARFNTALRAQRCREGPTCFPRLLTQFNTPSGFDIKHTSKVFKSELVTPRKDLKKMQTRKESECLISTDLCVVHVISLCISTVKWLLRCSTLANNISLKMQNSKVGRKIRCSSRFFLPLLYLLF